MEFYHHSSVFLLLGDEIKVKKAFPRTIDPSLLRCIFVFVTNSLLVTCSPFEHSSLYVFNNVSLPFLSVSSSRYGTYSNPVPSHEHADVHICPEQLQLHIYKYSKRCPSNVIYLKVLRCQMTLCLWTS